MRKNFVQVEPAASGGETASEAADVEARVFQKGLLGYPEG